MKHLFVLSLLMMTGVMTAQAEPDKSTKDIEKDFKAQINVLREKHQKKIADEAKKDALAVPDASVTDKPDARKKNNWMERRAPLLMEYYGPL